MNITYNEINIIYKYLYNKMDYLKFREIMLKVFPCSDERYTEEKWEVFQRDMMGFLSSYDRIFYQSVMNEIKINNYKG